MALFESLSERLNHIFSKLTKRGKLTELEIRTAMREVRVALLEADVNLKVAKQFIADVSEKAIERYLVEQAKQNGLLCLKYSNPNMVGYPDRLLVLPGGNVIWVELKSKGRKPTKIQQMRMAELTGMGHLV